MIERLRSISTARRYIVEVLLLSVPAVSCLEENWIFHSVCLLTTVVLLLSLFLTTRSMSLFSFHPLCMIFSCCLFIPEGIVAYKNHFLLESLSPIMQHSKRMKVRAIHQTMQLIGFGLMLMGFLFIVAEKMEMHESIIPMSIHSITALTLIFAFIVQTIVGLEKLQYHLLYSTNRRIRRWHGDMGLLVWDAICITLITGLASFLPWSIYSLIVYVFPLLLWLAVILQMIGKNAIKDEELDGEISGDIVASSGTSIPLTRSDDEGVDVDYSLNPDLEDDDMDESTSGLLANATPTRRRSHVNLASHNTEDSDNYVVERLDEASSFLNAEDEVNF